MIKGKRLMGIDPGLRNMGWGVIDVSGSELCHVANGTVTSESGDTLAERLAQLFTDLSAILKEFKPDAVAVEKTFVNKNPVSALKLGQARGIALLVPALAALPVAEYAPNVVKKSLVGVGHGDKKQIRAMVATLLPCCVLSSDDAADALSLAICYAHHGSTAERIMAARQDRELHPLQKGPPIS